MTLFLGLLSPALMSQQPIRTLPHEEKRVPKVAWDAHLFDDFWKGWTCPGRFVVLSQFSRHLVVRSRSPVRCTSSVPPAGFHSVDIAVVVHGRCEVLPTPH
jgi:hypothetical protein